jgi:hypothetical protein
MIQKNKNSHIAMGPILFPLRDRELKVPKQCENEVQ